MPSPISIGRAMTTPNLAKIEQERDLNKAWAHEAYDFTPWLAENIRELGEALEMDLGEARTEVPVGGYSLDILATDLNSSKPVIVENQLGATDHTHLGQLLTYAAGLDGGTVVWVTGNFRDEHRQALDWLNQRTGEDTQFFGVVIELWRIGDSPLAPHFRVVASPNEWSKSQNGSAAPTPMDQQNFEWRRFLIEGFRQRNVPLVGRRYQAKATWLVIESPVTDVQYAATWHRGNPGFEIIIHKGGDEGREWNQRLFDALEADKSEIDVQLVDPLKGERCDWQDFDRRQRTGIAVYRNGNVFEKPELQTEFRDWIIQKLYKFREVFTSRLKEFSG